MDVDKFIMKLVVDPSPHLDIGPNTLLGVASQVKDSLGTLRSTKDLPPIIKEPIELDNKEGWSFKVGSWSSPND